MRAGPARNRADQPVATAVPFDRGAGGRHPVLRVPREGEQRGLLRPSRQAAQEIRQAAALPGQRAVPQARSGPRIPGKGRRRHPDTVFPAVHAGAEPGRGAVEAGEKGHGKHALRGYG